MRAALRLCRTAALRPRRFLPASAHVAAGQLYAWATG